MRTIRCFVNKLLANTRQVMVVAMSIWATFCLAANAWGEEACLQCHDRLYREAMEKINIHPPFSLGKCEICHSAAAPVRVEQARDQSQKLRWLARQPTPAQEHWCDFSIVGLEQAVVVEASTGREVNRQRIVLPDLRKLPTIKNDRRPPSITDLKLVDMDVGILASATIAWKTDKVATSEIRYGLYRSLNAMADYADLKREHRVTLTGLKPNRIYSVQAWSRDVFDNENASDTMTISTSNNYSDETAELSQFPEAAAGKLSIAHELYCVNDKYLMRVTANRPIKFAVGALPAIDQGLNRKKAAPAPDNTTADHVRLKSPVETTIHVCYDCHGDLKTIATHPVNVLPKPGMVIPSEYPTLPDGRITCRSCHAPHAHDQEFLLLKSSKRALCIGCHKDKA